MSNTTQSLSTTAYLYLLLNPNIITDMSTSQTAMEQFGSAKAAFLERPQCKGLRRICGGYAIDGSGNGKSGIVFAFTILPLPVDSCFATRSRRGSDSIVLRADGTSRSGVVTRRAPSSKVPVVQRTRFL